MYAKVFSSLFDGSLRGQSDQQLVFIYLMTHCDSEGFVDIIHGRIADDTGLPMERVKKALKVLEAPDESSRSKVDDGRRIRRIDEARDWGWKVVNYMQYRNMMNQEHRREQWRQARSRSNAKPVEADESVLTEAEDIYNEYPRKESRKDALKAIVRAMQNNKGVNIKAKVIEYATYARTNVEPKFIPLAATWFNKERFNDPPGSWVPKPSFDVAKQKPRQEILTTEDARARNEADR